MYTPLPGAVDAAVLARGISAPRLSTYLRASSGNPARAVALYEWNASTAGLLGTALGHTEVVLRNAIDTALTARHQRLHRTGHWLDDPHLELDARARDDIATARGRLQRAGAPALHGKLIAELTFGFWRFLLARRYTTTLWSGIRPGFPHMPGRDRRVIEAPVARLHLLRNRIAHHEPLLTEPLPDRYDDLLTLVGYVDPALRTWLDAITDVPHQLSRRP